MKCLLVGAAGVALLAVGMSSSLSAGQVARAQYCVAIDVTAEAKEELAQYFDSFARNVHMEIDASHPMARVYYLPGAGLRYPTDSSVMIALEKMGPVGSILSYTVLKEEEAPLGLLDQLKRFVSEEISGTYRTVMCEEIKGFSAPQVYY
jgi:hypothetical protein